MLEVNIKELIGKLEKRNDGGTSKDFIKMFGDVIDVYFRYREWVKMITDKNGNYRGKIEFDKNDFFKYINLIEDIEINGLKEPIRIFEEKEGIEIDGYHRLVILDKLGKKYVSDSNGTSR